MKERTKEELRELRKQFSVGIVTEIIDHLLAEIQKRMDKAQKARRTNYA